MESERLATLEQALAELQAKDANTQHKLDILISHIPQSENLIPSTQPTPVNPKAHGLKLALLSEFDGDHVKGMVFFNSSDLLREVPCGNQFKTPRANSGGRGAGFFPLQKVNRMRSLSYHNRFSVLPTCSVNETVEPSTDMQIPYLRI